MATLSGNKIKDTFTTLLKLETSGLTSSEKIIEDGAGVDSALKLSTDFVVASKLKVTSPVASATEATALVIDGVEVKTRELGTNAFNSTAIPSLSRVIGRSPSDYSLTPTPTAIDFAAVNNESANSSYQFGSLSEMSIGGSDIALNEPGVYRIDVGLQYDVTGTTPSNTTDITTVIQVNGVTISTAIRSKSSDGLSMVSFFTSRFLSASDVVTVLTSFNSVGTAILKSASNVEVFKLS